MTRARRRFASLAAFSALAPLAAFSALGAGGTVSCGLAAVGPAFGVYNPLNPAPLSIPGTLTVTCTLLSGPATDVAVTVSLSTGSSSSYAMRTMLAGASALGYNLYIDPAFTQVWGDGTGGSFDETLSVKVNPGHPVNSAGATIYGQIPARQNANPGSYVDTIIVTANY